MSVNCPDGLTLHWSTPFYFIFDCWVTTRSISSKILLAITLTIDLLSTRQPVIVFRLMTTLIWGASKLASLSLSTLQAYIALVCFWVLMDVLNSRRKVGQWVTNCPIVMIALILDKSWAIEYSCCALLSKRSSIPIFCQVLCICILRPSVGNRIWQCFLRTCRMLLSHSKSRCALFTLATITSASLSVSTYLVTPSMKCTSTS